MFRLTVNNKSSPNSVDIPLQQFCNCSLCPDCGFDTTYPSKLQSLISPTDFHHDRFPKFHIIIDINQVNENIPVLSSYPDVHSSSRKDNEACEHEHLTA
ncbi:unnamed protein product [Rotaria sordida]|uniref:Uncharacterized protein n=1 Tax=Rotaria sordida TaxID=392033 RepID=A0A814DKQ1_9BILA|nr:unnamed protein product [Rotaria sordida]